MSAMDSFLNTPNASKLLKDPTKLERLRDAPETQKMFALLQQNTTGSLEQAAQQAAKGDTAPLMSAIRSLMQDPAGAKLIEHLKGSLK